MGISNSEISVPPTPTTGDTCYLPEILGGKVVCFKWSGCRLSALFCGGEYALPPDVTGQREARLLPACLRKNHACNGVWTQGHKVTIYGGVRGQVQRSVLGNSDNFPNTENQFSTNHTKMNNSHNMREPDNTDPPSPPSPQQSHTAHVCT